MGRIRSGLCAEDARAAPSVPPGYDPPMPDTPMICPVPSALVAPGAGAAPFRRTVPADEVPQGAMLRWTVGDLDLLVAHTSAGIVVTEDRCPHMAAPLSIGRLEGCVVDCVLHRATFDLSTGETLRAPTLGGLDAEGASVPPWAPPGAPPKPEPSEIKARARALTRTRRLRYYPVRIVDGTIEVRVPAPEASPAG